MNSFDGREYQLSGDFALAQGETKTFRLLTGAAPVEVRELIIVTDANAGTYVLREGAAHDNNGSPLTLLQKIRTDIVAPGFFIWEDTTGISGGTVLDSDTLVDGPLNGQATNESFKGWDLAFGECYTFELTNTSPSSASFHIITKFTTQV